MPVEVEIRVDGDLVKTLHVGRVPGEGIPGVVNRYLAVFRDPGQQADWHADDVIGFAHNESEPIELLVYRALNEINRQGLDDLGAFISGDSSW